MEGGGDFPRLNRYIQKGDCYSPKQEEWKGRRPSVAGAQNRAEAAAAVLKYDIVRADNLQASGHARTPERDRSPPKV